MVWQLCELPVLCPVSLQMKRALVLGASALLILALNQNAIREVGQACQGVPSLLWCPADASCFPLHCSWTFPSSLPSL